MRTITSIVGSMFSGKTRELINRYNKNVHIRGRDSLYISSTLCKTINSHDGEEGVGEIRTCTKLAELTIRDGVDLFIDEGQFFEDIYIFCRTHPHNNITIACITTDFTFTPYEHIGKLLCVSDHIIQLKSICEHCKISDGIVNHRRVADNTPILVGDKALYQPLCFDCWRKIYPCQQDPWCRYLLPKTN